MNTVGTLLPMPEGKNRKTLTRLFNIMKQCFKKHYLERKTDVKGIYEKVPFSSFDLVPTPHDEKRGSMKSLDMAEHLCLKNPILQNNVSYYRTLHKGQVLL